MRRWERQGPQRPTPGALRSGEASLGWDLPTEPEGCWVVGQVSAAGTGHSPLGAPLPRGQEPHLSTDIWVTVLRGLQKAPCPQPLRCRGTALPSPSQTTNVSSGSTKGPGRGGGGLRGQSPPLPRPRFPHRRRIYFYSSLPGNARDDAGFSFLVVI